MRANDKDIGLNGAVAYSLSVQTAAGPSGHLFGIDNTTGDIFVKGSVDFEDPPTTHRLVVVARDRGLDSVPVSVVVVVHVTDANDNSPEIVVETLSAVAGVADIAEDSSVGTFVAHVTVADRDSGNNGRYELLSKVVNLFEFYKLVTHLLCDCIHYVSSLHCIHKMSPDADYLQYCRVLDCIINSCILINTYNFT